MIVATTIPGGQCPTCGADRLVTREINTDMAAIGRSSFVIHFSPTERRLS